tara:strand:+ start:908 stop:1075 length:168 start_codon:yes stop_codon:yes gene_type:complete
VDQQEDLVEQVLQVLQLLMDLIQQEVSGLLVVVDLVEIMVAVEAQLQVLVVVVRQ